MDKQQEKDPPVTLEELHQELLEAIHRMSPEQKAHMREQLLRSNAGQAPQRTSTP